MSYIITLVLGDDSGDGHGQTETINIRSSLDQKAIKKAYASGIKKLGFDFCNDVASEYESTELDSDKWEQLKKLGYQDKHQLEKEAKSYNDGNISLWTKSFADIYLFIIKLGNKDFEFEYLSEKDNPQIKIGGYGLFG